VFALASCGSARDNDVGGDDTALPLDDAGDGTGDDSTADDAGPLRRFTIASWAGADPCPGTFQWESKWIMEGVGKEIPLLQFVYHPAMAIRVLKNSENLVWRVENA
jgi:hypothetical protein